MPRYLVRTHERYHRDYEVEAPTPDEAQRRVLENQHDFITEVNFEYASTTPADEWDVRDENGEWVR